MTTLLPPPIAATGARTREAVLLPVAPELAVRGETWDDCRRLELAVAARWLDAQALAWLAAEERAIARLERTLGALPEGPGYRTRAEEEGRRFVSERLDLWYAELLPQVVERHRHAARRLGIPARDIVGRVFHRLDVPVSFLDIGARARALADALRPRPERRRRARVHVCGEARLLLRANATRLVDAFKQRFEDSLHGPVAWADGGRG
jgi:hypothetical protein